MSDMKLWVVRDAGLTGVGKTTAGGSDRPGTVEHVKIAVAGGGMDQQASAWFQARTSASDDWPLDQLLALKGDHRISVVLPALDEETTVGDIVTIIRRDLMINAPLVDEVVVLDSGSTDRTAAEAAAAGATVVHRDAAVPDLAAIQGKGEAMWRSLFCATGDIVVFIDADLTSFSSHFVTGLLGPLLADPAVDLVKGFYDRPMHGASEQDGSPSSGGGGRVTELVARPLLALHWPELAGVVQPLAGEYAARRSLLEQLPFPCGYGVELGLLVDTVRVRGLDALAQVDLGERHHRHQDLRALGRMAAEIWQVALDRLDRDGRIVVVEEPSTRLTQFDDRGADGRGRATHDVALAQRPPAITLPEYAQRTLVAG